MGLADSVLSGDVRALARAISLIENDRGAAAGLLRQLFARTGRATVIGVTGAPGSGKSSLVDRLVATLRAEQFRVGVVAVDPSSAFSGGAILGDRVRMLDHAADPGVFIRSMATRGYLGGLARATNDVIDLIDAAGYDPILVETVGVGQDEIDVVKTADAVAVVLVPGMGDDIQAIKAGILEIADLFVINKSDRPGAARLEADLEYMLNLVDGAQRERPAIVRTVAVRDEGIDAMRGAVRDYLESAGRQRRQSRRRDRAEARFMAVLTDLLVGQVIERLFPDGSIARVVNKIAERQVDPYSAAERIIQRLEVR
jgi:LAO/AO transport system kinase